MPSSGQSYHSITRVITNLTELILYFRRKKCESYMLLVKTMLHCWALNSQKPGRKTSWKGEKTVIDVPGHTSDCLSGNLEHVLDFCSQRRLTEPKTSQQMVSCPGAFPNPLLTVKCEEPEE